jgi:hypothetical protein
MRGSSFRLSAPQVVPARNPGKRLALLLGLLVAGCGGGHAPAKLVDGTGYSFEAPGDWAVSRVVGQVSVAPEHGEELVRVSRLPLIRRFRPSLWAKVVPELDRAAATLARQQAGSTASAQDVTIGGEPARTYDVRYTHAGAALVERITFVLREKTEYFLLCRFERRHGSSACALLLRSFSLSG